jgi:CHASE3 domain sensor protein
MQQQGRNTMKSIFGTWTVKKKLLVGFLGVGALVLVVGLLGSQKLAQVRHDTEEVVRLNQDAERLAEIKIAMLAQVQAEKDYLLSGDSQFLEAQEIRSRD